MADYSPPTPDKIKSAQNADPQLKLLLAQRRFYSRAKIWGNLRGMGLGLVAVAAPIVVAIWPDTEVWVASIAAIWFALNRLLFRALERYYAVRAATLQERFDTKVFGMPDLAVRDTVVLEEEITRLTGGRIRRRKAYSDEKLRGWYVIDETVNGGVAVALAQRGNVAYTQTLLGRASALWLGFLIVWIVVAITVGIVANFSLSTWLLAVALPVLPPWLDAFDEWVRVRSAGKERRALVGEIESAARSDKAESIRPEQLLAWQSQLFALRRDAPLVPDWIYWFFRKQTEREMSEATRSFSAEINRGEEAQ